MEYQGNPGTNALAMVLSGRMCEENKSPLVMDFGSVNHDYSLKTNTFPVHIPKNDYTVCRHITGSGAEDAFLPLRPGDRVLVAWVDREAVVIDVILPANRL